MGHLALGLVLLAGTLAASSPPRRRDLDPLQEVALDMAPNSFDDQYRGCGRMMEEELEELNRSEFARNRVYAEAWTLAAAEWRNRQGHIPQPPALRPEHAVALLAYTLQEPLYREFNAAVREAGRSREKYLGAFCFKTLHFLLTEALRVLRDAQPRRCHRVYRGVRDIRFTAQQHQSVRFGRFTSTSLQNKTSQLFGQDTTFLVETCYGARISNFSSFPGEEEVLIPPFESFEVSDVARDGNRALIQLRSQDARSTYNCELVKGDAPAAGWGGTVGCRGGQPPARPPPPPAAPDSSSVTPPGRSVPRDPPRFGGLLLAAMALAAAGRP
uniref:NAD(P)(+)--arginine ADP-ribosyltransferase n=1 Tax=Strix occidentalis caurina TaxID=311401 RepID=A0A8D0KZE9_STROC